MSHEYKSDPIFKSADFDEVYAYAKRLTENGFEVRMTANNGQVVRLENGNCVVRYGDEYRPYAFSQDDIYGHNHWGIRYRKKKGPWKGIVQLRREADRIFPEPEDNSNDEQ